jgi:valyl-tRNA synthetase
MHDCMKNYRLDLAAMAIYEFTWHEFCDWYLELSKPVLQSDDTADAAKRGTRRTLIETLEAILRLLHPLMPFITEEIWAQVAPRAGIDGQSIMLQSYPEMNAALKDDEAEGELDWVMAFILGIRQIRGEMDISPGKALPVLLESADERDRELAERHALLLARVGRIESVDALADEAEAPPSASALLGNMRLLVPMAGLIDVAAESARLGKQRDKVTAELTRATAKLANENFVNNAPEAVVTQEKARVTEFESQIERLDEQLARLDALH